MVNWCTAVSLLTSLLLCGYIQGQCPGPGDPICGSCINDTAVCSRRCIGCSSYSRNYITQICTGHEDVIQNVDLSFNSLNYLDCSSTSSVKFRILNISHNNITIDDYDYGENNCYNTFKYLEYIDLSFNRIKNSLNTSTFPLTKLKHVNLSYNEVTSLDNLPFFSEASNIHVLDVSYNYVSYLSWDSFRNKANLVYVNISFNNFNLFSICHYLLPEPTGVFDIGIYKNNGLDAISVVFSNVTRVTHLHSCDVSISVNDFNSSLYYADVYCNATYGVDLFHSLNDNNTLDQSYRNKCMCQLLPIPCHIEEVSATPFLTNSHILQETTSSHEANSSTSSYRSISETKKKGTSSLPTDILIGVSCAVILLSLFFLVFIGLFSLKLHQIIKERQYSQRLNHSVSGDIYEDMNRSLRNVTKTLDFSNDTTVSSDEITRQENYSAIPELEVSSVTLSLPSEGRVDTYEEPTLAEEYSHPNSANGYTSTNAAHTINTLRPLPPHRSTGSTGGSACYYTLVSSCEDVDKKYNDLNSKYAKIDGDDLEQGIHAYDQPYLRKNSKCSLITTETTSYVLESLFDNRNSFTVSTKTGQSKDRKANLGKLGILDQTIEVGEDIILHRVKSASLDMITNSCYLERSEDMNQKVSMKEEALGHNKSVSLDMLTNPCYAPVTSHKDIPENRQSTCELAALDDHDPSEKPQKYDPSFLKLKSESATELKSSFDENNCLHTTSFFTPGNQSPSRINTASTNLDVGDEILNEDQIGSPEMIMNPWYQPILCNNEKQSSHKSKPSEVEENPFEYVITSSEDHTMLLNPCYMPIEIDSKNVDTETSSGVLDSSQCPNGDEDPFDGVATEI